MTKRRTPVSRHSANPHNNRGRLRIGDDWNAITIIALSQSNPLKAVAEFVENSIDARATQVTIMRGKERGQAYLRIIDDGDGVPKDADGLPDFKYVATHVCDSVKRRLSHECRQGIQGEYGIGLLSFWTVGETLTLSCTGADGRLYEMCMAKGDPGYSITKRRRLLAESGTRLTVKPLLPGIRNFSGEKLQWYLASELRDRIRTTGVKIRIVDRQARTELTVEPRQFAGRLLHDLPDIVTSQGEVYMELYLAGRDPANQVGLYRSGTRVVQDITVMDEFRRSPWSSNYLQGIVDAPFLNLTPGTRLGVVQDARFAELSDALRPVEETLDRILAEQRKAEEEQANRDTLRSIQKAFREALLTLPEEEYEWFALRDRGRLQKRHGDSGRDMPIAERAAESVGESAPMAMTAPSRRSSLNTRDRFTAYASRLRYASCRWISRRACGRFLEIAAIGRSSPTCSFTGRYSKVQEHSTLSTGRSSCFRLQLNLA